MDIMMDEILQKQAAATYKEVNYYYNDNYNNLQDGNVSPFSSKGYHSKTSSIISSSYYHNKETPQPRQQVLSVVSQKNTTVSHQFQNPSGFKSFQLSTLPAKDTIPKPPRFMGSFAPTEEWDSGLYDGPTITSMTSFLKPNYLILPTYEENFLKTNNNIPILSVPEFKMATATAILSQSSSVSVKSLKIDRPNPMFHSNIRRDFTTGTSSSNNYMQIGNGSSAPAFKKQPIIIIKGGDERVLSAAGVARRQSISRKQPDDRLSVPDHNKEDLRRKFGAYYEDSRLISRQILPSSGTTKSVSGDKTGNCGESDITCPDRTESLIWERLTCCHPTINHSPSVNHDEAPTPSISVRAIDVERLRLTYESSRGNARIIHVCPKLIDLYTKSKCSNTMAPIDSDERTARESSISIDTPENDYRSSVSSTKPPISRSINIRSSARRKFPSNLVNPHSTFSSGDCTSNNNKGELYTKDCTSSTISHSRKKNNLWTYKFSGIAFVMETSLILPRGVKSNAPQNLESDGNNQKLLPPIPKFPATLLALNGEDDGMMTVKWAKVPTHFVREDAKKISVVIAEPGTGFLLWKADVIDYELGGGDSTTKNCGHLNSSLAFVGGGRRTDLKKLIKIRARSGISDYNIICNNSNDDNIKNMISEQNKSSPILIQNGHRRHPHQLFNCDLHVLTSSSCSNNIRGTSSTTKSSINLTAGNLRIPYTEIGIAFESTSGVSTEFDTILRERVTLQVNALKKAAGKVNDKVTSVTDGGGTILKNGEKLQEETASVVPSKCDKNTQFSNESSVGLFRRTNSCRFKRTTIAATTTKKIKNTETFSNENNMEPENSTGVRKRSGPNRSISLNNLNHHKSAAASRTTTLKSSHYFTKGDQGGVKPDPTTTQHKFHTVSLKGMSRRIKVSFTKRFLTNSNNQDKESKNQSSNCRSHWPREKVGMNKSMISQPCQFQHLTAIKESDFAQFYSLTHLIRLTNNGYSCI